MVGFCIGDFPSSISFLLSKGQSVMFMQFFTISDLLQYKGELIHHITQHNSILFQVLYTQLEFIHFFHKMMMGLFCIFRRTIWGIHWACIIGFKTNLIQILTSLQHKICNMKHWKGPVVWAIYGLWVMSNDSIFSQC